MLTLATVFGLLFAGLACFVRDSRVNATRRSFGLATAHDDLERMFRLPARVPRREPA